MSHRRHGVGSVVVSDIGVIVKKTETKATAKKAPAKKTAAKEAPVKCSKAEAKAKAAPKK